MNAPIILKIKDQELISGRREEREKKTKRERESMSSQHEVAVSG